jgi:phosphoesterase RecJ-like protein
LRVIPAPQELLDFILTGSKFLLAGHLEPDGDCVGSQLALASALRRLGKEVVLCSAGPFKRTEIKPYASAFVAKPSEAEREGARVIVLDCGRPDRLGDLEPFLRGLPTAVIDHHATGGFPGGGDSVPFYLNPDAPATAVLVLEVFDALGLDLKVEEAELLFFALATDTGYFRHVDQDGAECFSYAARLIRSGANPKKAYQAIYGGKTLASRILIGRILSNAQSWYGGKLILSTESLEDNRLYGLEGRDSDSFYQLVQTVAGVEAVVLIRQESPEKCTLGFRSRDAVDVAAIAAQFGGGGHKNAAGLSIAGTIEELRPKIIEAFRTTFQENP